jgi:NADH:ubiquinone oxidoreductase subunit F (NADH-binding)
MIARLDLEHGPSYEGHLSIHGPLPDITVATRTAPGSLLDEVERAGLRGRGGGWFPTHLKLRAVWESTRSGRLARSRRAVVIGNGMEGEPASSKDEVLLARSPHLVLDGIEAAARTIGASDAVLAVHEGSPTIDVLMRALAERPADRMPITLVTPPARYVASEESALAHWVGDGDARPVYPERPFQSGAGGRPTLVQNAETLAHLGLIARHGGDWFAQVGSPRAPGTTLVTVGGAVGSPGVIEVATGTSVRGILDHAGGPAEAVRGFLMGGYGGSWVPGDAVMDTPWEPESLREAGAVIGASLLWTLGDRTCPIEETARIARWMAGESAGQCGPCVFGLPSVADDLDLLATGRMTADGRAQLQRRLGLVAGRGGCKHPDGVSRMVASALTAFHDDVQAHMTGACSTMAVAR